jgi:hypothetical protein
MNDLRDVRLLEPRFFRAPSAHNTQPWVLDYAADAIALRFDPERHLSAGDPTRRDLLLSLGALVEAVVIVATADGVPLEFVADVDLGAASVGAFRAANRLAPAAFTPADLEARATSRLAYTAERLPEVALAAARATLGRGLRLIELSTRRVADLYVAGDRALYDDPRLVEELRSWLRLDPGDPRLDGLAADCLNLSRVEARGLSILLRPGVYRLLRATRMHRLLTSATKPLVAREGSVLVLVGAIRTHEQMLETGRSLLRSWLSLTRSGFHVHPLSQILDAPSAAAELSRRAGVGEREKALCVFRVGRSAPPARSRRLR